MCFTKNHSAKEKVSTMGLTALLVEVDDFCLPLNQYLAQPDLEPVSGKRGPKGKLSL
jgi:hypothetical protein